MPAKRDCASLLYCGATHTPAYSPRTAPIPRSAKHVNRTAVDTHWRCKNTFIVVRAHAVLLVRDLYTAPSAANLLVFHVLHQPL